MVVQKNLLNRKTPARINYPQVIRDDGAVFEVYGSDYYGWEICVVFEFGSDDVFLKPKDNAHSYIPIPKFNTKIQAVKYMIENADKFTFM